MEIRRRIIYTWRSGNGVDANGAENICGLLNKLGKRFTCHYIIQ